MVSTNTRARFTRIMGIFYQIPPTVRREQNKDKAYLRDGTGGARAGRPPPRGHALVDPRRAKGHA